MDRLPPSIASTGKNDMSTPHTTTVSSRPASPSTFHPTSPKSSAQLLNIQFHIASVNDLPLSSSILTRWLIKRSVHVTCTGTHDAERSTDAVAEVNSIWDENLGQIGPVVATDKITFNVEKHTLWSPMLWSPMRTTTIATSKEYTVDALLVLQGKRGEKKSISIPLQLNHDASSDATLVLRVQEPTTDFVSKQWKEEAEMLERRREADNMQ